MTSSATTAVHNSSMASSPESPTNNGGDSFAVTVGSIYVECMQST